MKKIYTVLMAFLLALFVLSGCAATEQSTEEQSTQTEENQTSTEQTSEEEQASESEQEEAVTITISENNQEEIVAEEEVPVEEGEILYDVMEENFDIEATEEGFITSIEGVSQNEGEGKYWMYYVNGEMAEVGAQDYKLEPGDEVTFDLQAME